MPSVSDYRLGETYVCNTSGPNGADIQAYQIIRVVPPEVSLYAGLYVQVEAWDDATRTWTRNPAATGRPWLVAPQYIGGPILNPERSAAPIGFEVGQVADWERELLQPSEPTPPPEDTMYLPDSAALTQFPPREGDYIRFRAWPRMPDGEPAPTGGSLRELIEAENPVFYVEAYEGHCLVVSYVGTRTVLAMDLDMRYFTAEHFTAGTEEEWLAQQPQPRPGSNGWRVMTGMSYSSGAYAYPRAYLGWSDVFSRVTNSRRFTTRPTARGWRSAMWFVRGATSPEGVRADHITGAICNRCIASNRDYYRSHPHRLLNTHDSRTINVNGRAPSDPGHVDWRWEGDPEPAREGMRRVRVSNHFNMEGRGVAAGDYLIDGNDVPSRTPSPHHGCSMYTNTLDCVCCGRYIQVCDDDDCNCGIECRICNGLGHDEDSCPNSETCEECGTVLHDSAIIWSDNDDAYLCRDCYRDPSSSDTWDYSDGTCPLCGEHPEGHAPFVYCDGDMTRERDDALVLATTAPDAVRVVTTPTTGEAPFVLPSFVLMA